MFAVGKSGRGGGRSERGQAITAEGGQDRGYARFGGRVSRFGQREEMCDFKELSFGVKGILTGLGRALALGDGVGWDLSHRPVGEWARAELALQLAD